MVFNEYSLIEGSNDFQAKIEEVQEVDCYIRALINCLPNIAWLKNKEGRFILVNEAYAKLCGYRIEDILGKSDFDIWPKEIADRYVVGDKEVIDTGKTMRIEKKIADINGKLGWVETIKSPVFNKEGNIIGTTGIVRDVTENVLLKRIMEQSRGELEKIIQGRTSELMKLNERLIVDVKEKENTITNLQIIKEVQDIITTISTNFINMPLDDLDNEINKVIKIIGLLSGADRSYIYEYQYEKHSIVKIFEWRRAGVKNNVQAPDDINGNIINEFIYNLKNSKHIYISDKSQIKNNKTLYEAMNRYRVKSMLAVPMIYNNNFIGILGFDTVNESKEWRSEIVSLLRVIGNIFASVFERKYSERRLKELQENLRISYENEKEHLSKLKILNDELNRQNEILNKLAITDGLTGLYNHKHILEILKEEDRVSRKNSKKISIVMIDIDHFKMVNDKYGHQFGDEVLLIISSIIRRTIKDTDFAGRYGGEEFLILLTDTDENGAYETAEAIRKSIENYKWSHNQLTITISGGTAQLGNEKVREWIKAADDRLYISKGMGRNRIATGINTL